MSYSGKRNYFSRLPNQSLAVTECGLTICDPGHRSYARIYGHYSAHFILEGKGTYYINGKEYPLTKGQGFMIIPDAPVYYIADAKEPWRYIYANFIGPDDAAIVHYAGLNNSTVTFDYDMTEEMISDLHSMLKCNMNQGAKGYDVTGYFFLVMSRLIKAYTEKKGDTYLPEHYVNKAISYIEDNYPYNITIGDIASFVGIDRTYLYRLFLKNIKISPAKYLTNYRLERAVAMMEHDSMTLHDIALSSGFYDTSHFTKAFTLRYGATPGKYRKDKFDKEN